MITLKQFSLPIIIDKLTTSSKLSFLALVLLSIFTTPSHQQQTNNQPTIDVASQFELTNQPIVFFFIIATIQWATCYIVAAILYNEEATEPHYKFVCRKSSFFSIMRQSYSEQVLWMRRIVDAYLMKAIFYFIGFSLGFYSAIQLWFVTDSNQLDKLTTVSIFHIEANRLVLIGGASLYLLELIYRSKTQLIMIAHHLATIINIVWMLIYDTNNLSYMKIFMVYTYFVILEFPESLIMTGYRLFCCWVPNSKVPLQIRLLYKRRMKYSMFALAWIDTVCKVIGNAIVAVMFIVMWNNFSTVAKIIFIISYLIFFAAQMWGPWLFFAIAFKLKGEIERENEQYKHLLLNDEDSDEDGYIVNDLENNYMPQPTIAATTSTSFVSNNNNGNNK
ncbi:hypothetical protein ABK040_007960 [Willaertia magna]